MKTLTFAAVLGLAPLPAIAAQAPQGPPMTEPPPRAVVQGAGKARQDRTARPPAMGQSTHAIMMPGQDMPSSSPVAPGASRPAPSKPPS